MIGAFSLLDKDGTRRHVDWDVFSAMVEERFGVNMNASGSIAPKNNTLTPVINNYFDLVDRGFLGVEWFNVN